MNAEQIPHNSVFITPEDRRAVDSALASGWIAQGREVDALETNYTLRYGGHAVAVSSGTAALYLALKAVGVTRGVKVAVPTYACSALLNAVYMVEAVPVLADVLMDTFCIDCENLEYQAGGAECVIAVHTFGAIADVQELATRSRYRVIEDCCHTPGFVASTRDSRVVSDASIFSFYATKMITGGQGGVVWSSGKSIVESVRDYRQFDCRDVYAPRFNFQMTDIQAALINSQLMRLDSILDRRNAVAKIYRKSLPRAFSVQSGFSSSRTTPYRFVVIAPNRSIRDALKTHLEKRGVGSAEPIQRYELLHRYLGQRPENFPVAEKLVDVCLSIPIYNGLTDAQIETVSASLSTFNP